MATGNILLDLDTPIEIDSFKKEWKLEDINREWKYDDKKNDDFLGYVVKRGLTNQLQYVSYDTLIITWEFFAEDKLHDGKIEFVLE